MFGSALRSWFRFPVKPIPHVIERATLSDSVGFLRGLRFPPTYITNQVFQQISEKRVENLKIMCFLPLPQSHWNTKKTTSLANPERKEPL
jgi:hypothetical protein